MATPHASSADESTWLRATTRYLEARTPLAEAHFAPPALAAFRAFGDLWRNRFTATPHQPSGRRRRELFLRFVRQCQLWERTFKQFAMSRALPAQARNPTARTLDELAAKTARTRVMYDRLQHELREPIATRTLPWPVIEALRVLGLPRDSSYEQVKHVFRRLARDKHPDAGGDANEMIRIGRAYQVLTRHYQASRHAVPVECGEAE